MIEPADEIPMIRVGKDRFMSESEAASKGYLPRLDPPVKGAPFFTQNAFENAFLVVFAVAAYHYLSTWLAPIVQSLVETVLP